ncbi:hypothetical protein LCGC14_1576070 [marine sediment metagenome]|uniref:DUF3168 domain-containing protein n=1 Tax=marine sediment metagenome TaxID=412755 RepID=A0A0F9KZ90_9ZZZZ
MSYRSAIYTLLSGLESNVHPIVAPQETTATYITYTIRRDTIRTQDGPGVYEITLTLNIFANELDDAITMAATMEAGIDDASGTYDSKALLVGNFVNEGGDYISDLDKYMIIQEYQLMFT